METGMSLIRKLGFVPVVPRKHLVTLFDRQRRITLLWELFFAAGFIALLAALVLSVWR
jgi:hypothetical protein